jgi:hypothetical protein
MEGKKMAATCNDFTDEQIAILKSNPNVAVVGREKVYFTAKFKEYFWTLYTKESMMPSEILRSVGIDPKILGSSRTRGMVANLKKEYAKRGRFIDVIRTMPPEVPRETTKEDEIARLSAEVEYLRQEREFLKKIIAAGTK